MYKIAITGPESTGKSTLAKQLAEHYNTVWVPEYAREYLLRTNGLYSEKDLLPILKGQIDAENKMIQQAHNFLFCDTDPLVIWVWSMVKYGRVNPEIEDALNKHNYDFYLLTYPDLAWEKDKLRESEGQLMELFNLYLKKIKMLKYPFIIIKGNGDNRFQHAIKALKRFD